MQVYGLHTRSNGKYPQQIENRDLTSEWDELVELTKISTDTFESGVIPSGTMLNILRELQAYKTTHNDMHLTNAVDLIFPFVEDGGEVVVPNFAPSSSDIAVLAFAQEFPMRNLKDYDIYEIVTLALKALPFSYTVNTVANGIKLFKWVGLPNYNPEQMVKLITLSVQRNLSTGTLDNLMRTPEYCMDERRREMIRANFGDSAAERFIEFCDSDVDARLEDIKLANYNLAHILGVDEFQFDEFVLNQMATQISTEQPIEETKKAVDDVVKQTVNEAKSTVSTDNIVRDEASKKQSSTAFGEGDTPVNKALAWSVIGASAIALGLLINKLRKL